MIPHNTGARFDDHTVKLYSTCVWYLAPLHRIDIPPLTLQNISRGLHQLRSLFLVSAPAVFPNSHTDTEIAEHSLLDMCRVLSTRRKLAHEHRDLGLGGGTTGTMSCALGLWVARIALLCFVSDHDACSIE